MRTVAAKDLACSSGASRPQVSVIVPCYNYGRYVGQAIDSLLSQSLRDIEIIVIDDASTDETAGVLAAYASNPKVRILHHVRNQGHTATFNEGIAAARGEFLALLSADDYCLSADALARQVSLLRDHPRAALAYSAHVLVRGGTVINEVFQGSHDEVRDGLDEFRTLIWGNYIPHSGTLIRRNVQLELGPYDARLPHAGDWDMWLRAAARWDIGYIATPLYAYRMHEANMHHASMSPSFRAEQALLTLARAFESLPPDARADILAARSAAERHALFQAPWFDLFNGRRRRAWQGIGYALRRRPGAVKSWELWTLLLRLLLMSAVGGHRYRRVMAALASSTAQG